MGHKPKIGIIVGTTRQGRFADGPTNWIAAIAGKRIDAEFEVVDLRDYPMPFFEEKGSPFYVPPENEIALKWAAKMDSLDGYIFITAEYNHSVSGVLKNALDYAYKEYNRKPATFVAYGGTGGARAVEHLRNILAELQVASLKFPVHIGMNEMLGIMREGKTMADYPYLDETAEKMLDELLWWTSALKTARESADIRAAA
ncbi:MAG: azr 1 [Rhizobium sp.]|nr:azr 1 [Rhizobium sp.]